MTSANKQIAISLLIIYVIALNGCDGYPTTTDIIPTSIPEEPERKTVLEIEITEIPPSFTESEGDVENAAKELTINFDTETFNNNTLSELYSDNNDDTTLTPITLPPLPSSLPFSEPSIVEIEVIDTNTAAEEIDQTTTTTTHLIDGDIIQEEEPHPDKKEILNELQNIWYYTEELGEDQNALKSSLASLIHMTYARVYDQSDETLVRLKFLLRRLRSRLLDQRSKPSLDSQSSANPIVANTTTQMDLEDGNISKNGATSIKNPSNTTIEQQADDVPTHANGNAGRDKRSVPEHKTRSLDGDAIFGMVDSDENSLFQQPIDKSSDKVFYSLMTERSNVNGSSSDIPTIPTPHYSSNSVEERIKIVRKVIGGDAQNVNNLDENGLGSNFVHLTIYQPDSKKNGSTIIPDYPTSTMSSTHSLFSSMSQFFSTTKKPHTNTKYEPIHPTFLKKKYSILKTTITTTQKPKVVNNYYVSDTNESSINPLNSMDDIIQSIINVLGTPIHKPSFSPNFQNNSTELVYPESTQSPGFDTLPSYLQKLADGFGFGNNFSNIENDRNFTNVSTISNSPGINGSGLDTEMDESLTLGDLSPSPTSTTMLNGTMEKVYDVINTFTNLPSSARFVLFFSLAISIASITLGIYSLGPPIVAVGVLGIIVPIFSLFLLQSTSGKKKAKQDIIHQLKVDDFVQALDMIANAMIKYEKN